MKKRTAPVLFVLCFVLIAALFLPGMVSADDTVKVDNGIPVVYLRIDESKGTIEDMLKSPDHSVYCYGTVSIDVPDGFHYSDFPELTCQSFENLEMSIRGRGNSTWHSSAKKPFKIKLDKKTDIFGLGKNKHWVLVANAGDPTLMRDRITAWLGDQMGFAFTPRGVPVDVVMVGSNFGTQYLGSYYLSENVRVDDNRVNIAELSEKDTDAHTITGGYMIQNSAQVRKGSPDVFYTTRGANWATHTPSFDTEETTFLTADPTGGEEAFNIRELGDGYKNNAQQKYIQEYIQHFEDVLFEEGTAYRELMDVETAAKYWLVNMFSRNADAYATGSTYIYKDRDPENGGVSKLFWGPLWDFDYAWEHSTYTEGFDLGHLWMRPMFYDRGEGGYIQELHKQWPKMKAALQELIKDGGVIDQYYAETKASAEADAAALRSDTEFDYHAKVEKLKTWIRSRLAWVDANFDTLDTVMHKVTFMADGEVYRTDFLTADEAVYGNEQHPNKEGQTFIGWLDEDGNEVNTETPITKDRTFTAKFVDDSEITHGKDIALVKHSDIITFNNIFSSYRIRYEVIPTDAEDQEVEWTSSDESIATVDEYGFVQYVNEGTVTFTAKLRLGETRTFTLTIVKADTAPYAQAISPEQATINLTVGEQSGCSIVTDPSPAKIDNVTYESDDPAIVTVDELGVLTAVAVGETKIHIRGNSWDENDERITPETEVTVIVSEKAPDPTPTPSPEVPLYTVTPDTATWTKASAKQFTFTVTRSEDDDTCFDHFTGVKIDDKLMEKGTDYTVSKGSTVVTFKAATLQKLATGSHTVTFLFDDGEAEAKLEVLAKNSGSSSTSGSSSRNAKTGDERNLLLWGGLLAVSFIVVVITLKLRKKEN